MKRTLSIISAVCLLAAFAVAQDSGRPGKHHGFSPQSRGQDRPFPPDPNFAFVGSEMHLGGKTVKGAPYSATALTESIQTLSNGSKITRTTTASVYRDSEGRTRTEQTLGGIPPFSTEAKTRQMILIQDPVAGVHYVLDPANKTAQQMKAWSGPRPANHPPSSSKENTESLGTQTIDGLQVEGTRSTITIPAGQIGNDQPIEIVSERWYSPELQVVVSSKHTDPRMGEHTYRLTNISRSEPAQSLFSVPSDYTISERSFGPRPRGNRQQNNN
jgi:hypothetical protein